MDYRSATKRKEGLRHTATWMELEDLMRSKTSQTQKLM